MKKITKITLFIILLSSLVCFNFRMNKDGLILLLFDFIVLITALRENGKLSKIIDNVSSYFKYIK